MRRFLTNMKKGLNGLIYAILFFLDAIIAKVSGMKVLVFQLHAANQIPHILSVIEYLNSLPFRSIFNCTVLVMPSEIKASKEEFLRHGLRVNLSSFYAAKFLLGWDVIIAIDQRMQFPYINILKGRRLCMFHGQPTKGNVYSGFNYQQIDGLLFYGPLMKKYYFAEKKNHPEWPSIQTWEVGQPKSDELFNNRDLQAESLALLNLDGSRHTVVYAPSFENCASMALHGEEIIEALASTGYNLIVKPHPAFYRVVRGDRGIFSGMPYKEDWREYAHKLSNQGNVVFPIDRQLDVKLILNAAEVLITDHSGIAFDAIMLNKPVVYFDSPLFFSEYLPAQFGVDGINARNNITCNAGRAAGMVVDSVVDLIDAVNQYLSQPKRHSEAREAIRNRLLYNQGHATEAFVQIISKVTRIK